jgi:hypothetical protein
LLLVKTPPARIKKPARSFIIVDPGNGARSTRLEFYNLTILIKRIGKKNAHVSTRAKPKMGTKKRDSVGVPPEGRAHLAAITHIGYVYSRWNQYRRAL